MKSYEKKNKVSYQGNGEEKEGMRLGTEEEDPTMVKRKENGAKEKVDALPF
jgi:hypothetical protein